MAANKKTGDGASPSELIRTRSDFQRRWERFLEVPKRDKFIITPIDELSILGDAPKYFIHIREYQKGVRSKDGTAYIAKLGSKGYPNESFTEHLLTRLGQTAGVLMADSRVCFVEGEVRYLSKYFLRKDQRLTHGIEIIQRYIQDDSLIEEIERNRSERDYFHYQTISAAIREVYPEDCPTLLRGFLKMLVFDALVGNHDRHARNWGVVEPLRKLGVPTFAPVYDTARGLFWNSSEAYVEQMESDKQRFEAYVKGSIPQIGWDGLAAPNHFEFLSKLACSEPEVIDIIRQVCHMNFIADSDTLIHSEFADLMSTARRTAIIRCLELRFSKISEILEKDSRV